jgi:hypothetical protein
MSIYAVYTAPITDTPVNPECFITRIASMLRCGAGVVREHLVIRRDYDGVFYSWTHPRATITYHPAFSGRWGYVEDDGLVCGVTGIGGNPAEAQLAARASTKTAGIPLDTGMIDESLTPQALLELLPDISW